MIIKGGTVLNDSFKFEKADIKTDGCNINEVGTITEQSTDVIDATDCYVVPGFIDTHMHGAVGCTMLDMETADYEKLGSYEASMGTTSLIPAISAAPKEKLFAAIDYAKSYVGKESDRCATLQGIHLEGPFFSVKYKGAHKPENIRDTNLDEMREYCERAGELLKLMTLAPELPNAEEVIRYAVSQGVTISIGHTSATYEDVENAISWGATQGTHTFNAMSALNHRSPNTVGALLSFDEVVCELICDFFHIHPAVVKLVYKAKGADKINMITDSEVGTGFPDGEYEVNGRKLTVKDRKTYTEDGTIAGGTSHLIDGIRNLVSIGIPLEDAIKMATKNPAEATKIYDKVGSLTVGKTADIVILDKDLNLKKVILRGKALN